MKKVTLLTESKYREEALLRLRELGILHPHLIEKSGAEDLRLIESELEKIEKALSIIGEEHVTGEPNVTDEAESIVKKILITSEKKDQLSHELEKKFTIRGWFEKWGAVSLESIELLKNSGVYVHFYISDKNAFLEIPQNKLVYTIKEEQNTVRFVFISDSEEDRLNFKEDPIPESELSVLESEIRSLEKEISELSNSLQNLATAKNILLEYQSEMEKYHEFNHVLQSMGITDNVVYLQGFCPVDSISEIKRMSEEVGLGYLVQDPDDLTEVPTLLRNPKWLRIIQPVFNFMGTLPGYAEQDISLVFLAFFSVFYAMLVGDAGYGLIILAATWLFSRKYKKAPKEPFRLMYLLGFTTVLWGLLSGTWFGSEKIAQMPVLKLFIVDEIYSFSDINQALMMQITFFIGAVHLSFARLLSAFKKINSLSALAEIGWIGVLWGMYFVANFLVLGKTLPGFIEILFISGVVLILLFANFQKNILKGFLITMSNLPLEIINTFSDVVSYIRLFAVGMATVIVAASFNDMAVGSGINSIISGLLAAIILIFGHALNITLAMMSVLVHGIRLNMLEFSGHVGMQWTGKKYSPFKE